MPPSDIVCEAVLSEWRAMWYGFIVTIHAFPVHEKSRVNLLWDLANRGFFVWGPILFWLATLWLKCTTVTVQSVRPGQEAAKIRARCYEPLFDQ